MFESLDEVLAELVVLVEVADLLAGEVRLDVRAEDLALDRVRRLPSEALRVLRAAPAVAAGLDEQLRHLLRVEVALHRQLRRRAERADVGEDVVLQDELAGQRGRVRRVVPVVEDTCSGSCARIPRRGR